MLGIFESLPEELNLITVGKEGFELLNSVTVTFTRQIHQVPSKL